VLIWKQEGNDFSGKRGDRRMREIGKRKMKNH